MNQSFYNLACTLCNAPVQGTGAPPSEPLCMPCGTMKALEADVSLLKRDMARLISAGVASFSDRMMAVEQIAKGVATFTERVEVLERSALGVTRAETVSNALTGRVERLERHGEADLSSDIEIGKRILAVEDRVKVIEDHG